MAVLATLDDWEDRVEEIADSAAPITGNKTRALSLLKDMVQTRVSLRRLSGIDDGP